MSITMDQITAIAKSAYCKKPKDLTTEQLHLVIGKAVWARSPTTGARARKSMRKAAELTTSPQSS